MMMLPTSQTILTNHSSDLHVDFVVNGMAEFDMFVVYSVTTVRQPTRLKRKRFMEYISLENLKIIASTLSDYLPYS